MDVPNTRFLQPRAEEKHLHQIGKPLVRTDVKGKSEGRTRYAGDYVMPNMLHAVVLRAPMASATLKHIDVTRARALPGVACILTASDITAHDAATDLPGQTGRKRLNTDNQILVRTRVRYHGEPLALIAADTRAIAEHARSMIEFELEPLEGVYDPEDALKPGAPIVQSHDNIVSSHKVRKGDIEKAFADADHIIENTYRTQFIEHAFLEPEVGLAWVDENEVVNIRVSTQVIEHFRTIAEAIGVAHNRVRILGALVGGGFGGKEDITVEVYLALLALATRRPVKMVYSREDSWFGHGKRHPFIIKYRTGVTNDGRITGSSIDIIADAGAYVFLSPYVLLYCVLASPGPYRVDNLHVDAVAVATNNMFTSAFRGFGACQAAIAHEQQMDEIANVLGMDRVELRRVNYLKKGDPIATGFCVESEVWTEQCVDQAMQALGNKTPARGALKIGQGVAAYQQSYGRLTMMHDTSECWVGIEMDGTVVVRSGVTDIGAGQGSALCQIAGELLGVPLGSTVIYNSDSAVTPLAGTSTASRALYMTGMACKTAASALRERLIKRAAQELGVQPEHIDLANSKAFIVDQPEEFISLKELVGHCARDGIHRSELAQFNAPFTDPIDSETGQGRVHPDYVYGAQAIEVAVDTDTGEVTVLKSVAAHDIGQCINRAAVEGQIEGGTAMGIGYALSEELIYKNGQLMTPSFSEYLIPTAEDTPLEHTSIILESRSGLGPFGAKGIGEPALTPVAPAVANAVADAIGVRVLDFPVTPEKILKVLTDARFQRLTPAGEEGSAG